jgi:hypothetical protein
MRICVSQEHINRGRRGDPCSCAVALAIRDALPGTTPEVAPVVVYLLGFAGLGLRPTAPLPPEATRFIDRFDRREAVAPFEFDLPIEQPAAALAAA